MPNAERMSRAYAARADFVRREALRISIPGLSDRDAQAVFEAEAREAQEFASLLLGMHLAEAEPLTQDV